MELKIKTMAELADSRVKVEITVADQLELWDLAQKLGLHRTGDRLEAEIQQLNQTVDELKGSINAFKAREQHLRSRVNEVIENREEERKRADANREWAERAEKHVAEKAAELAETNAAIVRMQAVVTSAEAMTGVERTRRTEMSENLKRALSALDRIQAASIHIRTGALIPASLTIIQDELKSFYAPPGPPALDGIVETSQA